MNVYWRRELRVKKTRWKQILTMTAAQWALSPSLLPSTPPFHFFHLNVHFLPYYYFFYKG